LNLFKIEGGRFQFGRTFSTFSDKKDFRQFYDILQFEMVERDFNPLLATTTRRRWDARRCDCI